MDANGTRFHLLLGRDDWAQRARTPDGRKLAAEFLLTENANFSWDKQRNELTLGVRVFRFSPPAGEHPVEPSARRGAAADACGNVYWIDATGTEILVNSAGTRTTSHFWSSLDGVCVRNQDLFVPKVQPKPKPIALSGLAVTTLQYLIAGTVDPPGLIAFDLAHGGEPRQILWPVEFAPFDMAPAADGGVWILDREHRRAWRLDLTLSVVPFANGETVADTFQPIDGSTPTCRPPVVVTTDMARQIDAGDPVAIDVLPDDSILILDTPAGATFSDIIRITDTGSTRVSTNVAADLVEESKRADFTLAGHDFAYQAIRGAGGETTENILYVVGNDGNQAVAFQIRFSDSVLELEPLKEFYPMRLFGAKALIPSANGPLYDAQDRWVPLIAQRRQRFAPEATLIIDTLDGKQRDCVWHRLMLDACIPPQCEVDIASRAGNDRDLLSFVDWQPEPKLLRRAQGSELAWSNDTREAGIDTWELLFQRAVGRYLELRIALRGTGRHTPRVRALRAWYPRFSYLDQYLPAVYRENAESASFLDRFLANTEGFFTDIEDRIAAAQCLLDVRSAPADAVDWLASWFGVALDPAWDDCRRRLFVQHAAEFFEHRGTVPGLLSALRLISDACVDESVFDVEPKRPIGPRITEKFVTRPVPYSFLSRISRTDRGLPLRVIAERWDVSSGAADLHRRWRELIGRNEHYPITAPSAPDARQRWVEFSRTILGFIPHAEITDTDLFQEMLQRRYSSLEDLNRAWRTNFNRWSEVPLPNEVPERPAALSDWVHFEGFVLPARDSAHRFVVFLPQGSLGIIDREKKLDLARRVIALEKPAHTSFEVKFYWAFFRVGEARVGADTVVDLGSRSPELLSPFVLDRNYLGSGWLQAASSHCGSSNTGGTR
jgi:phage tail-like protein